MKNTENSFKLVVAVVLAGVVIAFASPSHASKPAPSAAAKPVPAHASTDAGDAHASATE